MSGTKTVCVSVLLFNHAGDVRACLDAVLEQTYPMLRVVVTDNASEDGSWAAAAPYARRGVLLRRNGANLGYAAGHNAVFAACGGDYFLPLNPDVILTPAYVERLVAGMECEPRAGLSQGKLLLPAEGAAAGTPGRRIDSAGLVLTRARRCYDRGHGEEDGARFARTEWVFGATGAAAIYRRELLEDIAYRGEYFDPDFFAYREDADMAWRAQLRGWGCLFLPEAEAVHRRRYTPRTRRRQPPAIRRLMFRNRYLLLVKNDEPRELLRHLPQLLAFEAGVWAYAAVREPFLFGVLRELRELWPAMLAKRHHIQSRRRLARGGMRPWFV